MTIRPDVTSHTAPFHRDWIERMNKTTVPTRPANPPTITHGFEPIPAFLRRGPAPLPLLPGSVLTATRRQRRRNFRAALFRLWERIRGPVEFACVLIAVAAYYGLCVVTP